MATTLDFGTCERCKGSNSKTLDQCRHCGAPLSWAKAKAPARGAAGASFAVASRPSVNIDWGGWGLAVLAFAMPIIGYFLYRSYSEQGSERAGPALIGSILGVLFYIARVAMRSH